MSESVGLSVLNRERLAPGVLVVVSESDVESSLLVVDPSPVESDEASGASGASGAGGAAGAGGAVSFEGPGPSVSPGPGAGAAGEIEEPKAVG